MKGHHSLARSLYKIVDNISFIHDETVDYGPEKKEQLFRESLDRFLELSELGKIYWKINPELIEPKTRIEEYSKDIKKHIESGFGLILIGGTGVGKTCILSYLMQRAFQFGYFIEKWCPKYKIRFCPVSRLFNLIFEREFYKIEEYMKSDFLMLDDFGREYSSDFPLSKFEDFIEYRYSNLLATCITTNISVEQLRNMRQKGMYARIVDRFNDKKTFKIIQIAGESQRNV